MKKRIFLISAVIIMLGCLWTIRYNALNDFYDENFAITTEYYQTGDMVPFEENILYGESLDGYHIRIDNARLIDRDDFLNEYGVTANSNGDNQPNDLKICDLQVTIQNTGSEAEGVYFPYLTLHGIDYYGSWDEGLIALANPVLGGNLGLSLETGQEYSIHLIYTIRKESFTNATWKNLLNYPLWLRITQYPVEKEISITFSTSKIS